MSDVSTLAFKHSYHTFTCLLLGVLAIFTIAFAPDLPREGECAAGVAWDGSPASLSLPPSTLGSPSSPSLLNTLQQSWLLSLLKMT
jgi:hypothetical protein